MHDATQREEKAEEQMRNAPKKCIDFLLQYSRTLAVVKVRGKVLFLHVN